MYFSALSAHAHTHTLLHSSCSPLTHTHIHPLPCLTASASLRSEKASIPMRCGLCLCCCFEMWGSRMLVGASLNHLKPRLKRRRRRSAGWCRPVPLLVACCEAYISNSFLLCCLFYYLACTALQPICCPNESKNIYIINTLPSGFNGPKSTVLSLPMSSNTKHM